MHALRLGLTDPRFAASPRRPAPSRPSPAARAGADPARCAPPTSAAPAAAPARRRRRHASPTGIAAALDADGTDVHRPELGALVAAVPADPQARNEARQAVAAVDDEAVRLRSPP